MLLLLDLCFMIMCPPGEAAALIPFLETTRLEESGIKSHNTIAPLPNATFPRKVLEKRGSYMHDMVHEA